MADYSVTAANVRRSSGASVSERTCGESGGLAAGDVVYLDLNDLDGDGVGKAKKADANLSVGAAHADGVCVGGAALGQPVLVCNADPDFVPGCTLAAADHVVLSANAGKMAPYGDLAAGWFYTPLGYAKSTTVLALNCLPSGVSK